MQIFKVTVRTLIHKDGKGYCYLCELCCAFYKRFQTPRRDCESEPASPNIKKCDGVLCKAGSDLLMAAYHIVQIREQRELIALGKRNLPKNDKRRSEVYL